MAPAPQSKPSFTARRRWGTGFDLTVRTLVVLAVVVMLNHLAGVFFHRQYLSEATKRELSPLTRNVIASITNDVKVTIYYDRDDKFYPTIAGLLREYQALNLRIKVTTVDYLREAAEAQKVKTTFKLPETSKAEEKNFVIFECGKEWRVVPGNLLTTTRLGQDAQTGEWERRVLGFNGETTFTYLLRAVAFPQRSKAYVLQGHGEHNIESGDEITGYLDFKSVLQQNAIEVEPLTLSEAQGVPADCNLLVIPGPRAIPPAELEQINQYLNDGGRLFALFNANGLDPNRGLERILAKHWGVDVSSKVVVDPEHSINSVRMNSGRDVTVAAFSEHPAVQNLLGFKLNLLAPRVVDRIPNLENVADAPMVQRLMATEPTARLIGEPELANRSYCLAVAVEQKTVAGVMTKRGNTRIIVVGDSFFLANEPIKYFANRDFVQSALNWLLARPQYTEGIGPKSFTEFRVTLTKVQMQTLGWLLLGAIPGGILLFGGLVWWRRRK